MKKGHLKGNDKEEIKSETISQLAHRHLRDRNHTTTDEELRNARIEINDGDGSFSEGLSEMADADDNTVLPPLPFEKNINGADTKILDGDTEKDTIPNPYDVLK